jgi:hypothetical protein
LLEWPVFVPQDSATMGLAADTALSATRRTAVSRDEIASWTRRSADAPELRPGARAVVPPEAGRFFRAEWLRPDPTVTLEPAFSVVVVVAGSGRLVTGGGELVLAHGDTVLVPFSAGSGELSGAVEAFAVCPRVRRRRHDDDRAPAPGVRRRSGAGPRRRWQRVWPRSGSPGSSSSCSG